MITQETPDISHLLQIAKTAAMEAGEAIMQVYTSGEIEVDLKADNSPLTKADRAAHEIISRHLAGTALPILSEEGKHQDYEQRKNWTWYWLVDPLDGTKEFVKRNGEFTVNIALMHESKPVGGVIYAPVLDSLYLGSVQTGVYREEQGLKVQLKPLQARYTLQTLMQQRQVAVIASRTHLSPQTEEFIQRFPNTQMFNMGSSLKFMLLAEGKADVYPRFAPTMEWDTGAAHAILNALNRGIYQQGLQTELKYNKEDLLNPNFVAL
ncbi:3'(2'),5'-bisphosphate nucleotidase CysQ [Pontibacter korlensis]|uniref:3'(2'),5'-bisphosphate nucleotidase CysQ n=1 Tax=Pontibacter korlensis TaxID=400092 RepID=A0A0E3UZ69_9BACT|nr:3'(2'),5'-bisphosphate nucleotidase CysQ [Pontibacter korlensis]AKD05056.1 3'-5'-bisphosphate nucleotidase [Pontibacter korlensis]